MVQLNVQDLANTVIVQAIDNAKLQTELADARAEIEVLQDALRRLAPADTVTDERAELLDPQTPEA